MVFAKINKHFPEVDFVTYSVEEPCFTSCLPQILKQFGFKYAVLKMSQHLLGEGILLLMAESWLIGWDRTGLQY